MLEITLRQTDRGWLPVVFFDGAEVGRGSPRPDAVGATLDALEYLIPEEHKDSLWSI